MNQQERQNRLDIFHTIALEWNAHHWTINNYLEKEVYYTGNGESIGPLTFHAQRLGIADRIELRKTPGR